jgi:hypothetical protein
MLFVDILRHLYIILFVLVLLFLMLGCNWPCLAVVKPMNKLIELNYFHTMSQAVCP